MESLAFAEGAPFQGAALLAFNDAQFSDADFASISRIGDSVKRDQAGKTGRFGCATLRQLRRAQPSWGVSLTLPLQDRLLVGLSHHRLAELRVGALHRLLRPALRGAIARLRCAPATTDAKCGAVLAQHFGCQPRQAH